MLVFIFGFNPRARVGRDINPVYILLFQPAVSIHAPAWGATNLGFQVSQRRTVSIHAPAWGATL